MGNIEIFEALLRQYDTPDRIKIAKIVADEIRQHIIDGREKTAIDYGAGTGFVGMELANSFKSILFIDGAKNIVDVIEQKIVNAHFRHLLFQIMCIMDSTKVV